jgi:hypothetical protein
MPSSCSSHLGKGISSQHWSEIRASVQNITVLPTSGNKIGEDLGQGENVAIVR